MENWYRNVKEPNVQHHCEARNWPNKKRENRIAIQNLNHFYQRSALWIFGAQFRAGAPVENFKIILAFRAVLCDKDVKQWQTYVIVSKGYMPVSNHAIFSQRYYTSVFPEPKLGKKIGPRSWSVLEQSTKYPRSGSFDADFYCTYQNKFPVPKIGFKTPGSLVRSELEVKMSVRTAAINAMYTMVFVRN